MSKGLIIDLPKTGRKAQFTKKDDFHQVLQAFISQYGAVERLVINPHYYEAYCLFSSEADAQAVLERAPTTSSKSLQNMTLAFTPMTSEDEDALIRGDPLAQFVESRRSVFEAYLESVKGKLPFPANTKSDWIPPIPGLLLVKDFITEGEEAELLEFIYGQPWSAQLTRKVQHYGIAFDYITRSTKDQESLAKVIGEAEPEAASTSTESLSRPIERNTPLYKVAKRATNRGFLGDAGNIALNRRTFDAPVSMSVIDSEFEPSSDFPETDQITINEYPAGKGISGHVDTHASFQDGIMSLSLACDSVMEFTYTSTEASDTFINGQRVEKGATAAIILPRRSLLVLRGEARYGWSHAIPARKTDCIDGIVNPRKTRVSATFRISRKTPCACKWISNCFDQNGTSSTPSVLLSNKLQQHKQLLDKVKSSPTDSAGGNSNNNPLETLPRSAAKDASIPIQVVASNDAIELSQPKESHIAPLDPTYEQDFTAPQHSPEELETKHVHSLYDAIAPHFSSTRHSRWPRVEAFLRSIPPGALVADIGCGNGKYLGANPSLFTVGCDRSLPLVEIAKERGHQAFVADALAPPFRSGVADVALSIAVLHHISTVPRRIQLFEALIRSLRVGGLALVYAWALEQGKDSRRVFESQDVFVPWCLQRQYVTSTPEELAEQGAVIDDERGIVILQRYCHVYRDGELEELLERATKNLGGAFHRETTTRVQEEYSHNRPSGTLLRPEMPLDCFDEKTNSLCAKDAITKNVCTWGRSLAPVTGTSSSFGVQVLESWWEKDNWCILFKKTE